MIYNNKNPLQISVDLKNLKMFILLSNFGVDIDSKDMIFSVVMGYCKENKIRVDDLATHVANMLVKQSLFVG